MKIQNIDFLFIGGIFPKEDEEDIIRKSKRGLQLAANNLQWSLIHGFDYNLAKPVTIMNTIFVSSFPKNYSDWIIHEKHFSHKIGSKDINLGFINLTIIKQFFRPFGEKRFLRQWSQVNNLNEIKVAFIYSLTPRSVQIAKELKELNPNIFVCVAVLDLTDNIMLDKRGNSALVQLWKASLKKRIANGLKYIDGFMIVTKHMAKSLNIQNKPFIVIETLINVEQKLPPANLISKNSKKRVVYTGGLIEKYGVLNLVQAFMQIDNNDYELIICGDGECKNEILEKSRINNQIKYMGVLNLEEVRKIQQSATVLVNPTQNSGDFTKYSFPIKTIEYLLSGRPVICYKLDGIPSEYDDYLFYVEDNSIETLKNIIIQVCELSEDQLINISSKNREFVIKQKNHKNQTRRILSMILDNINIKIKKD